MTDNKQQNTEYESREIIEARFRKNYKNDVNFYNELLLTANRHGADRIIVEDTSAKITYKKLIITVNVLSSKLNQYLKNEQNVGVFLPNSIGNVVALFSLFKLGKTPAILNFSMGIQTLYDCAETAGIQTILTSREFVTKGDLQPVIDAFSQRYRVIFLEDVKKEIGLRDKLKGLFQYAAKKKSNSSINELILFTSGSESKPKGVVLTHSNIFANCKQALVVLDINSEDKLFNSLPMFHSFGLLLALLPVLDGIQLYLYPSPLHFKEIPNAIREFKATILGGTSTFLDGYATYAKDNDFESLKYVIAGAEKLKEDVFQAWMKRFGIRILEGYGVTETSPVISLNTPQFYKKGTVGRILPGMEYKVVPVDGIKDGGNLYVKGPNVMKGYLIHGKGFIPCTEWHDCGDIVSVDEEGFITIKSRLKRFAKIAGEMISLNLVEHLATTCYGYSGFYAVSVPDEKKGERIILFSTKEGIEEKELKKFIKQNKQSSLLNPVKIEFIEEAPVLGSGKTDYVTLTEKAKTIPIKKRWFGL